ncbi:aminotransferase class IV [Singulisphaera sp. PoT]|uniref:aminotransferase class IV n=1 Tax=Singulisphaera sp. PoT TaxID=3411797 RepID=UPI003BF48492
MESLACLNGELLPVDQARVPVWDRGFLFGDAVYEVMRIYQGRCWLEDAHMGRLRRSLAELAFPEVDLELLAARYNRTIAASEIQEGTVYIHLTRGVAPRAHAFPDPPVAPTEFIVVRPFDDAPVAKLRESGVTTISRPDERWGRCDIKSTNLLANVMAYDAAKRVGCFEAILIGPDGLVTEATHTSILWIRNGCLQGTPETHDILPGTSRRFLVQLAQEHGVPYSDAKVTLEELIAADEVLLAGTTTEVIAITEVDGKKIGDGAPGPLVRRLQTLYRKAVVDWLAPQAV